MQTKSILIALFFSLFCLHCLHTCAQSARFNAGIVAGLNFSELEGNGVTDYFGINAGLMGTAKLSRHAQLGLEILFSQNGEYILPEYYPPVQYGKVRLNHVEVPIHFDWLIGVFEKDQYYDWNLNVGVAYTRLISYNIENIEKENINYQVVYGNMEAILLQAGTTYHFTKNIGLNLKASLPVKSEGLGWTLAARFIYKFNG